jgi:phenylacetate-CoA ligase
MPVIRYPMSDIAEWVDHGQRTLCLVGREGVGVRVGPNSYDMTNLHGVVSNVLDGGALHGFQVLLRRSDSKDENGVSNRGQSRES